MRRGIAATAIVAALALTAAACGGDDGDSGKKASGKLSGTVTFWDTSNDAEKGTYEKLAKGFEKLHPDVKVNYVSVAFGEANAKFKNAAGGNSGAPDVMRTEVAWVADFANLGYLAPLEGTPPSTRRTTTSRRPRQAPSSRARPTPPRRPSTPWRSSTTRRCSRKPVSRRPRPSTR